MIKRSLLANSPMPSWNRTIIVRAKKRIAKHVLLQPAVRKKTTCVIKKKEAKKA